MKRKHLNGISLNQFVLIKSENRIDKVVRIDDHVHGNFCLSKGGRYKKENLLLIKVRIK